MVTSAENLIEKSIHFAKWIVGIAANPKLLAPVLAGSRPLFPFASRFLKARIRPNLDIRRLLQSEEWDLIIIPTSGADPALFDFVMVAEEMKVPTLALVDNWDNLVSKTVFWRKPTFLGVWGPQAKQQAVQIHDFEPEKVIEVGNPRFEPYFRTRKVAERGRQRKILFVGSAMPFDEIGALRSLESSLSNLNLTELEIVYRPHPWQQHRLTPSAFVDTEFRYTSLDEQISIAKKLKLQKTSTDLSFQPDLEYYPRMFEEALIVVGPLTTMLLEASICLRPVIGLAYNDGHHFTTTLEYFSHFSEMESMPGFQFCRDDRKLADQLVVAIEDVQIDTDVADLQLSRILTRGPSGYGSQLASLVAKILIRDNGQDAVA